jgi:hypothetical protein
MTVPSQVFATARRVNHADRGLHPHRDTTLKRVNCCTSEPETGRREGLVTMTVTLDALAAP